MMSMKLVDQKEIQKLRKKRNQDLLKRMKDGDPLKSFDSQSSWFPPRPIIKKDPQAIAKLYKKNLNDQEAPSQNLRKEPAPLVLVNHDHIA